MAWLHTARGLWHDRSPRDTLPHLPLEFLIWVKVGTSKSRVSGAGDEYLDSGQNHHIYRHCPSITPKGGNTHATASAGVGPEDRNHRICASAEKLGRVKPSSDCLTRRRSRTCSGAPQADASWCSTQRRCISLVAKATPLIFHIPPCGVSPGSPDIAACAIDACEPC